jgi:hypothetical protein
VCEQTVVFLDRLVFEDKLTFDNSLTRHSVANGFVSGTIGLLRPQSETHGSFADVVELKR